MPGLPAIASPRSNSRRCRSIPSSTPTGRRIWPRQSGSQGSRHAAAVTPMRRRVGAKRHNIEGNFADILGIGCRRSARGIMGVMIELRVLELLSARLCHELVSPVGAINNGVELLAEEDPDFVRDAIELIGQSARTASRRLQFYRFAYGTSASATGAPPSTGRD